MGWNQTIKKAVKLSSLISLNRPSKKNFRISLFLEDVFFSIKDVDWYIEVDDDSGPREAINEINFLYDIGVYLIFWEDLMYLRDKRNFTEKEIWRVLDLSELWCRLMDRG